MDKDVNRVLNYLTERIGVIMAFLGANGSVTSIPSSGEKICVGCEYWKGSRDITYNGTGATSMDDSPAFCTLKKADTYPGQPCSCSGIRFKKWSYLK